MKKTQIIRFVVKTVIILIAYFVLFETIHHSDAVPYLEDAITGDIETTNVEAIVTLALLRILFYFLLPFLISLFDVLLQRKIKLLLRSSIETFSIFYMILFLIKMIHFFFAIDKATGITILEGFDLGIAVLTIVFNIICYKNPFFFDFGANEELKSDE